VKLLDFGIARLHEASRSSVATHHGFLLGTPTYMAPEQARGDWEIVDGRTDLWSVGATLFRALTGRTVHEGRTHVELLLAATANPAPRLRDVQPTVPAPVAAIVDRALSFDMGARFGSAAEMLESVRAAHHALGYAAAAKLRVKIASDTTQRTELPRAPQASDEFDRAQALGGLPRPDDDELPTAVAAIDPAQRAALRSLLLGGVPAESVDVELDDAPASPSRSGIQGAGTAGREMASIFDETGESTVAMVHPPRHVEDELAGASVESGEHAAEDGALAHLGGGPTVRQDAFDAAALASRPVARRRVDRPLVVAWTLAGLAVAAFVAALIARLMG
jgi:hypothetical protein